MKVRRILAPVDFSDISENALSYATGLADELGAKVVLLYAIEPMVFVGSPISPEINVPPLLEDQRKVARQSLDKLMARLSRRGVPVAGVIKTGTPFQVILDVADAKKCDFIVMGTHGRGGLSHLLLGSVAERVVRLSPRPVLTVRGKDKAKAKKKRPAAKKTKKR